MNWSRSNEPKRERRVPDASPEVPPSESGAAVLALSPAAALFGFRAFLPTLVLTPISLPPFVLTALTVTAITLTALSPAPARAARIRSVRIDRSNVFDQELAQRNWFLFRWGNAFHVKTAESVIHSRVLYQAGDSLDSLRMIETERNLRALGFIGDVQTNLTYNRDSSEVDVDLKTRDQWSTFIEPSLASSGGESRMGIALEEQNLFGTGNTLLGEYRSTGGRTGYRLHGWAPVFLHRGINASLDWSGDGWLQTVNGSIWRPFYSLEERNSWSVTSSFTTGTVRYWSADRELFRYHLQENVAGAAYTRSLGRRLRPRLTLSADRDERAYTWAASADPYRKLIPPAAVTVDLSLSPSIGSYRYVRTTLLDNFGNVEDRTLGAWATLTYTRSIDVLRTDRGYSSSGAFLGSAWRWNNDLFGSAAFSVTSRFERRPVNVLYRPRLTLFLRRPSRMVTALRMQSTLVARADPYWGTALGGDLGLRGYPTYALTGPNAAVVNLEERYFSSLRVLTVSFGAIAFLDSGRIWSRGERVFGGPWRSDAGMGLRLGMSRVPGFQVLRMDYAWPLDGRPALLSFGTGMYFTL